MTRPALSVNAAAASPLAAAVLLAATLGACAPTETPNTNDARPTDTLVRGTILSGSATSFRPCGREGTLPLQPVDLFTRNLLDELTDGDEPIYAEFMARTGGRVPTMTITRLVHAARDTVGCAAAEPDYDLRAHGNEPFWSIEVRGDTAVWRTPENGDGLGFEVTSREQVGTGWLLQGTAGEIQLGVSFAGTACRDSMADAWFGYTVQLEIDDHEYRGCGRSGNSQGAH